MTELIFLVKNLYKIKIHLRKHYFKNYCINNIDIYYTVLIYRQEEIINLII